MGRVRASTPAAIDWYRKPEKEHRIPTEEDFQKLDAKYGPDGTPEGDKQADEILALSGKARDKMIDQMTR